MEEKNKHSLKKAINDLPKYSPKDQLWENLSDKLQNAEADKVLHESLVNLPTYEAPNQAWTDIEAALPSTAKRAWLRPLAAAAAIAILVGFAWANWPNQFGTEIVNVSYTEQSVVSNRFINVNSTNATQRDSAFRTIVRSQNASDQRAKEILAELNLLDNSKKRLKSRLSKYDTSEDLKQKLSRLEEESVKLQNDYLATI